MPESKAEPSKASARSPVALTLVTDCQPRGHSPATAYTTEFMKAPPTTHFQTQKQTLKSPTFMMNTGLPAKVTGISPSEGVPGTKLTLRGENFGQSAADLSHVFVGGIDVSPSARWFSPRKLSVITPLGIGELEIVIVTKSGGIGTADLTYSQTVSQKIGAQEQVSYWPEDERRRCPAIIERGNASTPEGGGDVADASLLFSATGIPVAELARLGIPLSDSALAKVYPSTGSVQLTESDFDPMLFLLKYYKNASFQDLLQTMLNFRQSIYGAGEHESSAVIKNNLFLIFRCLEGMEGLKEQMQADSSPGRQSSDRRSGSKESSKARKGTVDARLEDLLTDSRNQGFSLFEDVLRCREKADSARNVLATMQRFHFLFNLPEAIRNNVKQGEYNLAITDYKRAKSLFSTSDAGVFRRVYTEVESVMDGFGESLKFELLQMPIDVDEAIKRIKCLQQLDLDYDPRWLCMEAFKDWLVDQLNLYQKNYTENLQPSNPSVDPSQPASCNPRGKKAILIQNLVQKVCSLLSTHIVTFWRLQAALFNDTKRAAPRSPRDSEDLSGGASPEERLQALNVELVHLLARSLRECVLEPSAPGTSESAGGWASPCIQEFRNCCLSLPLEIVPKDAQAVLRRLSRDLRRYAIRDVLRTSHSAIESLHFKENWTIESNDEGGSITQLPSAYGTLILEALSRCKTLMSPRTSLESSLFDSAEYQERFPQTFAETMISFLSTLQRLADQIESSLPADFSSSDVDERFPGQINIVPQARGFLLLVTNADWAARRINTQVFNAYASTGYANVADLKTRVIESWRAATDSLVDRYVHIRGGWLCAPFRTRPPSSQPEDGHPDSSMMVSMVSTALCNLSHVHSELVLLLGVPVGDTANNTSSRFAQLCLSSPTYPDEVSLPSYCRMQPILQLIAAKLADAIQQRSKDAGGSVSFVQQLLLKLANGDTLAKLMDNNRTPPSTGEQSGGADLDGVKQSLRLVATALDAHPDAQAASVGKIAVWNALSNSFDAFNVNCFLFVSRFCTVYGNKNEEEHEAALITEG
ncbi:hypothetical protein AAHC03_013194 [Spirometra sp. Aus1]